MKKILNITNGTSAMRLDAAAKDNTTFYYNLAAGDPAGTALNPFDACLKDILNGWSNDTNHYCNAQGLLELRKQIYRDPNKVLIGNGAKILMYLSLMATCEPGDNVLVIGPVWSSYLEICRMLKLNIIQYIPYYKIEGWTNDIFEIEKYFYKTNYSAVIFINPNNPTGIVEDKYFVSSLVHLCEEHDCWLIADEIYNKLIYPGVDFETCLDKNDNVIYLNGLSKSAAVPGYRIGWCIANEELIQQMTNIQSQIAGPPNTLIQTGAVKFLKEKPYVNLWERNKYKQIIDLWCENNQLFTDYKPQGGLYFYIPVTNQIKTFQTLFDNHIIVTPGDGYGVINTIRISFSAITLQEAAIVKPYLDAIS